MILRLTVGKCTVTFDNALSDWKPGRGPVLIIEFAGPDGTEPTPMLELPIEQEHVNEFINGLLTAEKQYQS